MRPSILVPTVVLCLIVSAGLLFLIQRRENQVPPGHWPTPLAIPKAEFTSKVEPARAQPPARRAAPVEPQALDVAQPQSPARPAPGWLRLVDQGGNDPRLRGYRTPKGIKVEVVAQEPVVVNPVGMTFADDGTPYVLEWRPSPVASDTWHEAPETFTYKDGSKRQVATMKKSVKDVVKTLRDTRHQGVYDQATVVLEDELPSSILLHDGWIYLSGRGTLRRFRQSRPGGPYDVKEVIAQGFCGFHHHQVSGITLGNDGWLYVTAGDDDNYVEGSDGSRATVLRTGAVFRLRPDGSRVQPYAIGFRNPYRDVAFDAAGNLFHADNDNEDGSKFTGCRLMHVAEGCDFGWRLRQGARCCSPDSVRGAVFGELPGKVPPLLKTGRGSPAGLLIYNDTRFPEVYRGLLLYPDVFRRLIRAYKVERRGRAPGTGSFAVTEEFELMKSDDPLFRPCQMVLGPDGAMYVVDWRTDSGGAGRLWGDGTHGRIYRLTWAGTREQPALLPRPSDSWARLTRLRDEDLLKVLSSPEGSDRERARRELVRRGPRNRSALLELLRDSSQPQEGRIAALGALQSFWDADVQRAFVEVLEAGLAGPRNGDLRRLAAEGLGFNAAPGDREVHAALLHALSDGDPAVRRAAALAMGKVAAPGATDALVNALVQDDSTDRYLRDGLVRAIEALGRPGIERLLALSRSGELNQVVEVFTMMRTRPAFEALPDLLQDSRLSTEQRAALVRSAGNYLLDPPVSMQPLLDYLAFRPDQATMVQRAGLEVLSGTEVLKRDRGARWLLGLLEKTDPHMRLPVIKAIEDAHLTAAVPPLTRILGDSGRPAPERAAAVRALHALNGRSALPVLQEVLANVPDSAAPAEAALRLEAFRTLAALDPATAVRQAHFYAERQDAALQNEAVVVLGTTPEGARQAARLFLERKVSRALLPRVCDSLRQHAGRDPELARLLTEVRKSGLLLSNSPDEVERVRALVRTQGRPDQGRLLFLDGKLLACIKCHSLEGVGGSVGPDLTRIWETHSVEKILESILEPSKEIKEGYQTYQATTRQGKVYLGLKVAQTADEVILRDAEGKDVRIAARDLEELTASRVSLMPEDAASQLTQEQFIDLIAFLKDRKAQEALRALAPRAAGRRSAP